jgi:hypothetical protein
MKISGRLRLDQDALQAREPGLDVGGATGEGLVRLDPVRIPM